MYQNLDIDNKRTHTQIFYSKAKYLAKGFYVKSYEKFAKSKFALNKQVLIHRHLFIFKVKDLPPRRVNRSKEGCFKLFVDLS